jgi:hypothetical protein
MKTGWLILIGTLMLSSVGYLSSTWLSGDQRADKYQPARFHSDADFASGSMNCA